MLSPVMPQYRIRTNMPVEQASLEAHLYFQVIGGGNVGAKVEEETERNTPGTAWLVSPAVDLPRDRDCVLAVNNGIISKQGPEPGNQKGALASFHTLPPFRLNGIQCKDLSGKEIFISGRCAGVAEIPV